MLLSVAICTWNRADLLAKALDNLASIDGVDDLDWELLLVNNNCSDHTDQVIARSAERLPVRRLFEPEQGLSNARNAAVAQAAGRYILWTDDDIIVGKDWLTAYVAAFERWPEAAFFGGPILPVFSDGAPAWLQRTWTLYEAAFASRDLGPQPQEITREPSKYPFGANYCIRMDLQRQHLYDPAAGRKGRNLIGGEETAVLDAIAARGLTGRWVPQARVDHLIEKDRQSARYLRSYFESHGRHIMRSSMTQSKAQDMGLRFWHLRRAVSMEARYWAKRAFAPPEVWTQQLAETSKQWGRLRALWSSAA